MDPRYLSNSVNYSDQRDPDLDAPALREDITFPLQDKEISRENVRQCIATAPDIQIYEDRRVVRVRSDVVVKCGTSVGMHEANNMRLVHEHGKVRLPEVLDAWTEDISDSSTDSDESPSEERRTTFIVMRFVSGMVMERKWPELSPEQREKLINDIAGMIELLHGIEIDRPGPVGDASRCFGPLFTSYGAGPFERPEDLAYWLNNRLRVCKCFKKVPEDRPPFSIDSLVMCHMDLNPRNIIVDDQLQPWLVDWGRAGGYPRYFEVANLEHTRGTEYLGLLSERLCDASQEPDVRRLHEMSFAFSTGATCFRADLGIGDEY